MWSVKYLPNGIFSRLMSLSLLRSTLVILKSAAAIIFINFTTKKRKIKAASPRFMSLDNIQLPATLIHQLYKKTLVELDSDKRNTEILNTTDISFLGSNENNI